MNSSLKKIAVRLMIIITLGAASVAFAASGGLFSINWSALFPGGRSQQSAYTLQGAIGQPATSYSQSGVYAVQSGYLAQSASAQSAVGNQWIQYR